MANFADFNDWLNVTHEAAEAACGFNWLMRAHPIDAWYGSTTLTDLLPRKLPPHIGVCPPDWRSEEVIQFVDAVVTVRGTIGIEAAACGTPVLTAGSGWYHDCGFAYAAETRDDYRRLLGSRWWEDVDVEGVRDAALRFSGLYFCTPDWQRDFLLPDDTSPDMHVELAGVLTQRSAGLARELATIRDWFRCGTRFYHTFKMLASEDYTLSTPAEAIEE
jgi:hypothetical protein